MKKFSKGLMFIFFIILVTIVFYGLYIVNCNKNQSNPVPVTVSSNSVSEDVLNDVDVHILASSNDDIVYDMSLKTVPGRDLQEIMSLDEAFIFDGTMLTTIGTIENTNSEYWMLYVDGDMSSVGANEVILDKDTEVEWRYLSLEDMEW